MAVMIWDEQAQAFVEADVPMKYDPSAGAWKDTTGMAWDNEAQAWTERWGAKVSAYVYGAVSETVTIRKNGIVVATVQTDASGCSAEMVSLSPGTYDLTGSVSGWTEEQTVDKDTTKFRAMPKGSLYWYGNEMQSLTGGYSIVKNNTNYGTSYVSNNDIDCSKATTINLLATNHVLGGRAFITFGTACDFTATCNADTPFISLSVSGSNVKLGFGNGTSQYSTYPHKKNTNSITIAQIQNGITETCDVIGFWLE